MNHSRAATFSGGEALEGWQHHFAIGDTKVKLAERAPGVILVHWRGDFIDEALDWLIGRLEAIIRRRAPLEVFIDFSDGLGYSGLAQRRAGAWLEVRAEDFTALHVTVSSGIHGIGLWLVSRRLGGWMKIHLRRTSFDDALADAHDRAGCSG